MNLDEAETFLKLKGLDTVDYCIQDVSNNYKAQIPIAIWLTEFAEKQVNGDSTKKNNKCTLHSVSGSTDKEIIIESIYFWSDWTDTKKHKIDLAKTIGFNIDFRLTSWHVIVITTEKESEYEYRKNELSHEVTPKMVAEMIADDRIKILNIKNYHNSDNFFEHLHKVMEWAKKLRK